MYVDFGPEENKDYDYFFNFLHKFFFYLKKDDKLNPNFEEIKNETIKRIKYFDEVRKVTDKLDWILRENEGKIFDLFLKDASKYNFTQTHFMQNYSSLLIYNMLIFYANIEIMFLTMLKGAKYETGGDEIISGKESLGILLPKIFQLDKNNVLPKEEIRNILDIKIRNALAHGWFRIEKFQLIYFEESLESKPQIIDEVELLGRLVNLKIFGKALHDVVFAGQWNS